LFGEEAQTKQRVPYFRPLFPAFDVNLRSNAQLTSILRFFSSKLERMLAGVQ
jgi:hypothetical protein